MTKAFGYLRVSGKGQVDGDGFTRQREAIERYAKANGIEIVEWFEEKGVSGTTEWESRPAWSEMIGRLNGVRTIAIERLDRLARDLLIQEYILRDLRSRDVTLLTSAGEETGDEDPTRVLFRQLVGAIAQYEKTMLVRKMRTARNRQRSLCVHCSSIESDCGCFAFTPSKCEGKKPFGSRPGEAETLELMKGLRTKGHTFDFIAHTLNENRVVTRHGKQWHGNTVLKILKRK